MIMVLQKNVILEWLEPCFRTLNKILEQGFMFSKTFYTFITYI